MSSSSSATAHSADAAAGAQVGGPGRTMPPISSFSAPTSFRRSPYRISCERHPHVMFHDIVFDSDDDEDDILLLSNDRRRDSSEIMESTRRRLAEIFAERERDFDPPSEDTPRSKRNLPVDDAFTSRKNARNESSQSSQVSSDDMEHKKRQDTHDAK